MPLHLIKLCVGVDSLDELRQWYADRLKRQRAGGEREQLFHVTRMVPKRTAELKGGSLYWVIRGHVQARMKLMGVEPFIDAEGVARCRLLLDRTLIETEWQPRRAFQGWRYLPAKDAPRDLAQFAAGDLPPKLRSELAELGLL